MVKQHYFGMENEKEHVYRVHFGSNSCSESNESDSDESEKSCDGKPPPQSYPNAIKILGLVKPKCETLNEDCGEEWTNPILQSVQTSKNVTKQQTNSLQQSLLSSNTSKYCESCGQKIPNLIYKSVLSESDNPRSSNQHADFDFLQDFNESNMFETFGISDNFFCEKKYIQKYVETNADVISISALPQFKKTVSFFNKKKERNITIENILKLQSVTINEPNNSFGAFFIPELIQKFKTMSTKRKETISVEKQKLDVKIMSNNKKQCTESSSKNVSNNFKRQIKFENFIPSKILSQISTSEKKETSNISTSSKRQKGKTLKVSSTNRDKVDDKINNFVAKQTLDKPFDLRDFPELSSVPGKSKTSKAIDHIVSSNAKNGIKRDEMEPTLSNIRESLMLSPQSETINKMQNCSKDKISLETFLNQIYFNRNYAHSVKSLKSRTERGDENKETIEQLHSEYAHNKNSLFNSSAKIIIDEQQNELMNSVCKHHTEESFDQEENKESGHVEANDNTLSNNVEKEICGNVRTNKNKTKKCRKKKQKSCKPNSTDLAIQLPHIEHKIQNKCVLQRSAAGVDSISSSDVNHLDQVNKNSNLILHFQELNSLSNDTEQVNDDENSLTCLNSWDQNGKSIYNELTFETSGASQCFSKLDKDTETKTKIIREEAKRIVNSGKQNTKQVVDLPGTLHNPDIEKLTENKSDYINNVTESIRPLILKNTEIIDEQNVVLTGMSKYHVETLDQEKNVDSSHVKDSRNMLLDNNDEGIATNSSAYNTYYKKPFEINEISLTYSCNTNLRANESNPKKTKKSRSKKKKQNSNPNSVTPSAMNLELLYRENDVQEIIVNSFLTTLKEFDVKNVDISHSVEKQVNEDTNKFNENYVASNADKNLDDINECNNLFHELNTVLDDQFGQKDLGDNLLDQNEEHICSYEEESTSENIKILVGNEKNVKVNDKMQKIKHDFMDPPVTIYEHPYIDKLAGKKWYYFYNFTETKQQFAVKSTYHESREHDVLRSSIDKLCVEESLEPGKTDESSQTAEIRNIVSEINNEEWKYAYNADKSFAINEVQSTHLGNSKAKTKTNQRTKSKKKQQNSGSHFPNQSDSKVPITVNYSNDKSDLFNSVVSELTDFDTKKEDMSDSVQKVITNSANILVEIDNSSNAEINHLAEINENGNLVLPVDELILSKAEKNIGVPIILNHNEENVCNSEEDTFETNEGTSQYCNKEIKGDEKRNKTNGKVNSEKNNEFLNPPVTIFEHPYISNLAERKWFYNFNVIDNLGLQNLKDTHNEDPTYKQVENNEYSQVAINQNILVENNDEEEVHVNNCSYNTDITNQRAEEGKIKKNKSKNRKKKHKQNSEYPAVNTIPLTCKENDIHGKIILEKSTTNLRKISENNTVDSKFTKKFSKSKIDNLVLTVSNEDVRKVNIYDSVDKQAPNAAINSSEVVDGSSNLFFEVTNTLSKNKVYAFKEGLADITILDQNEESISNWEEGNLEKDKKHLPDNHAETQIITFTSDVTNEKLNNKGKKINHEFLNQQTVHEHDFIDNLNENGEGKVCDIEYVYNQEQNSAYKSLAKEVKLENTNIVEMPVENENIPLILKKMDLEAYDNGQLSLQHSGMNAAISDERSEDINQIPSESVCQLNSKFDTEINKQVKEEEECVDIFQEFTTLIPIKIMREVSERDSSITLLKNSAEKTEARMSSFFNESSFQDFVEPLRNEEFHSLTEYSLSLDQNRENLFEGNNGIRSFSSTPPETNSTVSYFNKKCIIS